MLCYNTATTHLYTQGHLSLSTVGDICAKDNFWGGEFMKILTNISIKIHIIIAVK